MLLKQFYLCIIFTGIFAWEIRLECGGPMLLDYLFNCTAFIDRENSYDAEHFRYYWLDSSIPRNVKVEEESGDMDAWYLKYSSQNHAPGIYRITLIVCEWFLTFCRHHDAKSVYVHIRALKKGKKTTVSPFQKTKKSILEIMLHGCKIMSNNGTLLLRPVRIFIISYCCLMLFKNLL